MPRPCKHGATSSRYVICSLRQTGLYPSGRPWEIAQASYILMSCRRVVRHRSYRSYRPLSLLSTRVAYLHEMSTLVSGRFRRAEWTREYGTTSKVQTVYTRPLQAPLRRPSPCHAGMPTRSMIEACVHLVGDTLIPNYEVPLRTTTTTTTHDPRPHRQNGR